MPIREEDIFVDLSPLMRLEEAPVFPPDLDIECVDLNGEPGEHCTSGFTLFDLSTRVPSIEGGSWAAQDDLMLLENVKTYGRKWNRISAVFRGIRSADALRNRYIRLARKSRVDPASALGVQTSMKRWTRGEDSILASSILEMGDDPDWDRLSSMLSRRSPQSAKKRAFRLGLVTGRWE